MLASDIPERTQTLSMAIYNTVQANNFLLAKQLAFLLTSSGFGLLFFVPRLQQKTEEKYLRSSLK
jgi:ABC-type molybdate transport system permease subunit